MNQRRISQLVSAILLVSMAMVLVAPQPAQAANWSSCSSVKDGNWDDYSTWSCSGTAGNSVPSDHTNVTIYHVVTIGSNHSSTGSWAGAGSLNNYGKLIMQGGLIIWGPSNNNPWVSTSNYLGGIYEGYGSISFIQGSGYTSATREISTGGWGEGYAPRIGCGDQYWYNWGPITCNISGNFQAINNTQPDGYPDRVGNVYVNGNVTLYETWYQYAGTINFHPSYTLTLAGNFNAGPWTYWNTSNPVEIPNVVVSSTYGWNIPPSLKRIYNYTNYSNGITKLNWGTKWADLTIDSFNNYAGVFDFTGLSGGSLTIGNLYNAGNTNAYIYSTSGSSYPLYLSGQINNTNNNNSNINRKIVMTGGADQNLAFGGWSAITGFEVNKSSGRAILNNNLYVQGNVDVTSGTLDLGAYTLSASNTVLTVQNGAGYYLSGASGLQYSGFNSANFNYGCTLGFTGSASREASLAGTNCTNLYLSGGPRTLSANLNIPGWLNINGATINLGSRTLSVGSDLTLAGSGALNGGSGVVTVGGNFTQNSSGAFAPGTGTLVLTGASKALTSGVPLNLNNLTFQNSSSYTPTSGATINVAGDWINNGSFIPNGSTVNLTGTNQILSGINTFYNLTKNSGAASVLSFPAGKKQTITNTLNLSGGSSSSRLALRSSTAGTPWQIDAQGTRTLLNLDVRDSNNVNASAMAAPTTNGNLDNGNNTNWNFVPTTVTSLTAPAAKTYKIGDTLDFTVNFTNVVSVAGATKPRLALTVGSSPLYANYFSGSGSKNIVFRYTVQSGDLDTDGIVLGTLGLNGGTITDNAGAPADLTLNNVASTALVKVDGVAPAVSSVSLPANKTYGLGDVLNFSLTFSEPVTLSGAPTLPLTVGAANKTASYLSGSGTTTWIFRYIVGATDVDADGIALSALSLNGGSILDAAGNAAALGLNGVPSTAGVKVDGTGPVTSSVAVPADSTYKIGDTLDFTVNWNKNVAVAGMPRLVLTVGSTTKYATYLSGTGSSALVFRSTVDEGDLDSNGIAITGLQLNGGTLLDAALGNAANLGLNSVASTANVKVDGVRATVSNLSGPVTTIPYTEGAVLTFAATWNEAVSVTGTPEINFKLGGAAKTAIYNPTGSTSVKLNFNYTVVDGDNGAVTETANYISGGSIQDAALNDAVRSILLANMAGDGAMVDTTPPSISSVTLPDAGIYPTLDNLSFLVYWNEPVTVTGLPQLALTIGSQTVQAEYQASGSSPSMTIFTYAIVAPDTDTNGIAVGSLTLNSGTIKDAASNNAALTLPVMDTTKILVDTTPPAVSAITLVSSSPTLASSVQFQVQFSEPVSGVSAGNFGFAVSDLGGTPVIDSITGSGDTYGIYVTGYTGSGTLGLNKSANTGVTDLAGNGLADGANDTGEVFTIDNQAPTVSSIGLPAAKTYTTQSGNNTLSFTLNWNEIVHVDVTGGTPRLALSMGAATRYATYQSGSDSTALTFSYTVDATDQAASGISIAELQLNGGSIADIATNPAFLSLPAADASGVKVQGTFALTLLTGGGGMGDVTASPNQTSFSDGGSVTLTATPLSNSLYVGASSLTWTPDNVSTPTYYTSSLTMTADTSVTVYFEIKGAAYVDSTYDASTPGWGITRFASIQTAIDTVVDGTLLNVSGTFTESVNLNKNVNLVLLNNTVINGSITQSDGTLDMPGGTLTLNGSLTKTVGTLNANGGTLKLTGASPSLSAGLSLASLEMAGSGTLTSGALTLSGDMTLTSGVFSPASGTQLKNVSIASGATLNAPAGTLSVGGNWTNNGTFNGNGGTLIFNGSGDQSLGGSSALSFSALQIASVGKVTTSKAMNVSGQLEVNSGTIDPYNGSSFGSLTVGQAGEFDLSSGGTVTISGAVNNAGTFAPAGGTLNISGLFTNSGSYDQSGGTVNALSGFSNSGTFAQSGGTLAVTGSFTNTGNYAQSGTGNVTVSAGFTNDTGSTYAQTGGTTAVTDGFSNISGASYSQSGGATTAASFINDGTFTQSGGTLPLTGDFTNTGTFAQSGTGSVTVGGNFANNQPGSFSATGGTLNLNGNLSNTSTSGAFAASGGTVSFAGSSGQTISGNVSFANLTLNNPDGVTTSGGTLAVSQTFTLSQGEFDAPEGADFTNIAIANGATLKAPAGSMTVSGDWSNAGVFDANGGTVTFDGTADQAISGNSTTSFNNLIVNKLTGTLVGITPVDVQNNFNLIAGGFAPASSSTFKNIVIGSAGSFTAPSGSLSVSGDWTNDGVFTPGTGTVIFNSSGSQMIKGVQSTAFNNLSITNGSALTVKSAAPATPSPSVGGTLDILNGSFAPPDATHLNHVIIASGAALTAPAGDLSVSGDWSNAGTFSPGTTGSVTFDGTGTQHLTGSTAFNNLAIGAASILQPASGVNINLGGDLSVTPGGVLDATTHQPNTLTVTGADSHIASGLTLSNLVIDSGAKLTAPAALSLLGDWTNNGTFVPGTGTVTFDGTGTQHLTGDTAFNNLAIGAASVLQPASGVNIGLDGDLTVTPGGTFDATTHHPNTLTVTGADTHIASGLTLSNLVIDSGAKLTAPAALALLGDWTNNGSFVPGTGSVTFKGAADQTIAGSTQSSFNNLTVANTGASSVVKFGSSTPAPVVAGILAVNDGIFQPPNGSDFNNVIIASGATLTAPAGDFSVSGDWSNAGSFTPGTTGSVTFDGTGMQHLTGNTPFNNLAIGAASILQPAANVNIRLGGDLSVTPGGVFDATTHQPNTLTVTGADSHIASGLTLSNLVIDSGAKLTAPAALSLLGDWTNNGTFVPGTGTVTFDGTGTQHLTGDTAFNNLAIGAASVLQPASGVNIGLDGDLSVIPGGTFDATTHHPNTLTVTGADSHIASGLTLSNLVIDPSARLTAPAALALLGDWTNNGSFVPGTGSVTFKGAADQTIAGSTQSSFNNLTVANTGASSVVKFGGSTPAPVVAGMLAVNDGIFQPPTGSDFNNVIIASGVTLTAPAGDFSVSGDWSNAGTFTPGTTGSVTFDGTGAQTISGTTVTPFHDLVVNKSGGTLTGSTAVAIANQLDVKQGTFAPASNSDFNKVKIETGAALTAPSGNLTVSGGWDNQGTFNPGTGTVTFDGTSAQAISGTANFASLVLDNLPGVSSLNPLTVAEVFTLKQGAFNPPSASQFHDIDIRSGSTLALDPADTLNVSGDFTNNGTFTPAGGKVIFNGSGDQAIGGAATQFSVLEINNTGGTVTGNVPVSVSGATTVSQGTFIPADTSTFDSLSVGALGTLTSPSGGTISVTHDLINGGTFTSTGGTLNVGGSFNNTGSYSANGGTTNITGSLINSGSYIAALGDLNLGGNLSNTHIFNPGGGTVTFNGSSAQTISGSGISFASLKLDNPAGVSAAQPITVKDTLDIARGSFNPPSASQFHDLIIRSGATLALNSTDTVSISGDFTNNGAFKPVNGSTVVMNGSTAQVIGGSNPVAFKNLVINNTAIAPAGVTSSRDILVSGTTTINDGIFAPDNGSMLSIVTIQPNGTFEVTDPDSITVTNNLTNNGTFSPTGGNISLWGNFINANAATFNPTGGTLDVSGSFSNAAGATFAPNGGTVNVTGDFNNAGSFAPLTGALNLLSNLNNTGSIHASGGTVSLIGTGAQQITGNAPTFANLVLDNLFGVSADQPITVTDQFNLNQGSFNPPSGSQLHDLTVASGATFTLDPADILSVSGDIANHGTLTPNGARMILNGSAGQAISGTPFTFGDLVINNTGSTPVTSSFPLRVAGLLDLKDGTLTLPSGSDLNDVTIANGAVLDGSAGPFTVSGDWSNLGSFTPGSGTVTFDGTGLQLFSGSTDFNNLIVGAASTFQPTTGANLGLGGSLDTSSGGTFDATTHEPNTLTILGAGPHNLPDGLALDNLVIASGATFTAPPTLSLDGNFTNDGTFNPNGGTVTLDGSGPQVIGGTNPTTFANLVIANTSPNQPVTSTQALDVTGDLTVQDGTFAPAAGSTLNDVTIGSGGILEGPDGNLTVSGDWTNNGTFTPESGSTVTFEGSAGQTIGGTTPTTFENLVIDNNSGVVTTAPIEVTGLTDIVDGTFTPAPGSSFGDVTINPGTALIIPPLGGLTIEGNLINNGSSTLRTLNLDKNGDGSGSFITNPTGNTFNDGQVVEITVHPARGSSFVDWSGALTGSDNPKSLKMDGDKSVTAAFTLNEYTLTLLNAGNGSGSITPDLPGLTYKFGTIVTLTPHAGTRSIFSSWSSAASGSADPLTITIEDHTTVTANFSLVRVVISGNAGVEGATLTITDSTALDATSGDVRTLLTGANGDFSFEVLYNWSGRVAIEKSKYTFTPSYLDFISLMADTSAQIFTAHEIFYNYLPMVARKNAEKFVYQQNFSGNVGEEWSDTTITTSPSGEKFLGEYGNNEIQLNFSSLPAHNTVSISFDLYIIRSWDGNTAFFGPDTWQLKIDNHTLLHTTFSNNIWNQNYPNDTSGGSYPFQTGAAKVNSLGYTIQGTPMDSVYHLTYTVDHADMNMLISFKGMGLQLLSDESWGLDNMVITSGTK